VRLVATAIAASGAAKRGNRAHEGAAGAVLRGDREDRPVARDAAVDRGSAATGRAHVEDEEPAGPKRARDAAKQAIERGATLHVVQDLTDRDHRVAGRDRDRRQARRDEARPRDVPACQA
jgi:hypothetical protein